MNVTSLEVYTKEVQFFMIFNMAGIFSWEYRLQNYLKNSFPLSLVRVYKVKWWNEFKANCAAVRILSITAGLVQKNSPYIIYIHLKPRQELDLLLLKRKNVQPRLLRLVQRDYSKGKGHTGIPQR